MAIFFSNNQSIQQVNNRITMPGRIVQTVHTTTTSSLTTTSTSAVDFFTSNTITMLNASNTLLIEWHVDVRTNDWGDSTWNLYYMDLVHVQSSTQISYTGFVGEFTYNIRSTHRVARHAPGTVGPHSYKCRGWSYTTLSTNFGQGPGNNSGSDAISYIRIHEIAAA